MLLPVSLLLVLAGGLRAQDAYIVVRLGTDTLSVERFRLDGGRLEGELVSRSPRVVHRSYTVQLAADGAVRRVEFVSSLPGAAPSAPPLLRAVADFTGDSAIAVLQRPAGVQTVRVAVPAGIAPMIGDWWAGYELMTRRARRAGADSTRFQTWQVGAPSIGWLDVVRAGSDSLLLIDVNQTHRARVERDGRLLGASRPVQQFHVERVASLDIGAVREAWAERERRQGALANLSPRDTVRASIGGAELSVDYSRPGKRGRVIFGGVVPWEQPWRTGANQPTRLETSRDLQIADSRVPAGWYSIWTVPRERGWILILNGGGSATYDPAQDRFRFDMPVGPLAESVEQFTIRLVPEGSSGGVLQFEWDTVRASIPFSVP